MTIASEQLKGGTRRRAGSLLAVVVLASAMFIAGGIGLLVRTVPAPAPQVPAALLPAAPVVGSSSLPVLISSLQDRLRVLPTDWRSFARLGMAYVQEARITADPTYYTKAEGVLRRSLQIQPPGNFEALTGLAALAAARHDFAGALSWGEKAVAANPNNANAVAVVGDALLELGRYDEAFATFQQAVDLKPQLSTYARVSYAWELQGNFRNAIAAMRLAMEAASTGSDMAWAANQLGELYWNSGHPGQAESYYRQAIARDPAFIPPHAGLAKEKAARGRLSEAIRGYQWVVTRFPLPEYVIALGDLQRVAGRREAAARQYALVEVEEQLFLANGVNVDLEIALFDADQSIDLAGGLAAAQAEWGRRHSIHVADALAWQLHANRRYKEAMGFANHALRLGTRNALFFFHRGMIEKALGRTGAAQRDLARALAINPHFSILWSKLAAQTLAALGSAR